MQPGMGAGASGRRIVFRNQPFPFRALNLKFRVDRKNIERTIVYQTYLRLGIAGVGAGDLNR